MTSSPGSVSPDLASRFGSGFRIGPTVPVGWIGFLACFAALPAILRAAVALHGVGDLPGGIVASEVRDAVKVADVIYAVGSSSANAGATGMDTAIVWSSSGGLQAIPNLLVNPAGSSFITASAITPDARFIAARSRSSAVGNARVAVRVRRSDLSAVNLVATAGINGNSAAIAISDDGNSLFGFGGVSSRAYRFSVTGGSAAVVPLLDPSDTGNQVAARGCSSNGSVMVGSSVRDAVHRAFRFVQGTGISALPLLPGGGTNDALAVSPDGNLTLLSGNSERFPNGEIYLHDATSGGIRRFGSPNEAWVPGNIAGLSGDGEVVMVGFGESTGTAGAIYFHNTRGWFHLASAVADAGMDLKSLGWELTGAFGISRDGTLVFGQGVHNGNPEGFVLEFPASYLRTYAVANASPFGREIIGSWTIGDATRNGGALIFTSDGNYFLMNVVSAGSGTPGMERGTYFWNADTGAFHLTARLDTNGDEGIAGSSGRRDIRIRIAGDVLTVSLPGEPDQVLTRVRPVPGTLSGGWLVERTEGFRNTSAVVFLPNGYYFLAESADPAAEISDMVARNGIEHGTYSWNPATGALSVRPDVDTNGEEGLSGMSPAARVEILSPSGALRFSDSGDSEVAELVAPRFLQVASSNGRLLLTWPSAFSAYSVQVSRDLQAGNWEPVSGTPVTLNGQWNLTLDPTPNPQWFRLFRP